MKIDEELAKILIRYGAGYYAILSTIEEPEGNVKEAIADIKAVFEEAVIAKEGAQ